MTHIASIPKKLNERLTWARKRKGISQERLAEMVGTSRRHVMRLERGQHVPKQPMRERLAEALDQDPEFFQGDEDDEEAAPVASLEEVLRSYVRKMIAEERQRLYA